MSELIAYCYCLLCGCDIAASVCLFIVTLYNCVRCVDPNVPCVVLQVWLLAILLIIPLSLLLIEMRCSRCYFPSVFLLE